MGKRGRRPHPDILTPREWEVLALLREGLTNERIAERLGVTLDGAKYHVSEILGKLGVSSREEAAALVPEEVRQPWWQRLVTIPVAAKIAGTAVLAAAAAGLGLLVWGVLQTGGPGEEQPTELASVSTQEFYGRVAAAVTRSGEVFHTEIEIKFEGSEALAHEATEDRWIDAELDRARTRFVATSYGGLILPRQEAIISEGFEYTSVTEVEVPSRSLARECLGIGSAISAFLECTLPDVNAKVEVGQWEGADAVILVTSGDSRGSDETLTYTRRIYFDAETFLPLGGELEGTFNDTQPVNGVWSYRNEFVDRGSLPTDFFDPADIGYVDEP